MLLKLNSLFREKAFCIIPHRSSLVPPTHSNQLQLLRLAWLRSGQKFHIRLATLTKKLWKNISNHSMRIIESSFHTRWDMIAHFMSSNLDNDFHSKGARRSFCAELLCCEIASTGAAVNLCTPRYERTECFDRRIFSFGTIVKWNVYRNNNVEMCTYDIEAHHFSSSTFFQASKKREIEWKEWKLKFQSSLTTW